MFDCRVHVTSKADEPVPPAALRNSGCFRALPATYSCINIVSDDRASVGLESRIIRSLREIKILVNCLTSIN